MGIDPTVRHGARHDFGLSCPNPEEPPGRRVRAHPGSRTLQRIVDPPHDNPLSVLEVGYPVGGDVDDDRRVVPVAADGVVPAEAGRFVPTGPVCGELR